MIETSFLKKHEPENFSKFYILFKLTAKTSKIIPYFITF